MGGRSFFSGESDQGKRNPHAEGSLQAAGFCEPDAGRRPGVHLVLRLALILTLLKAAPGPSATRGLWFSRANRLQNAGSRSGARIERGGDRAVTDSSADFQPVLLLSGGPLCPLSARVPNSGGSLEHCGMSPSLLPGFPHCWARFQLSLIC